MVAFRALTAQDLSSNLARVLQNLETKAWELALSLGMDPRTFDFTYTLPEPTANNDEQQAEKDLLSYQERLLNAYEMASVATPRLGVHMNEKNVAEASKAALAGNEQLLAQRCGEYGINPADLTRGWKSDDEAKQDLEIILERVYFIQEFIDGLS